jgi:hypothetical protein
LEDGTTRQIFIFQRLKDIVLSLEVRSYVTVKNENMIFNPVTVST